MSIQEIIHGDKKRASFSEKVGSIFEKVTESGKELFGNMKGKVVIRKMTAGDEDNAKSMIRNTLLEFGGIGVDSYFFDEELEYLYESFSHKGSSIIVAVKNGEILGTAAIKPLKCLDSGIVEGVGELKQFFIRTENRNQGIGNRLLQRILQEAKSIGYDRVHATASTVFTDLSSKLEYAGFQPSDLNVRLCDEHKFDKHFILNL